MSVLGYNRRGICTGEVTKVKELKKGEFYALYSTEQSEKPVHIATLEILVVNKPGSQRFPTCPVNSSTTRLGRVKSSGSIVVRTYSTEYRHETPTPALEEQTHYLPKLGIIPSPLGLWYNSQRLSHYPKPEPETPEPEPASESQPAEKPAEQYTQQPQQKVEAPEKEKEPKAPKPRKKRGKKQDPRQQALAGFPTDKPEEAAP